MEEIEPSVLCLTLVFLRHGVTVFEHKNEYTLVFYLRLVTNCNIECIVHFKSITLVRD